MAEQDVAQSQRHGVDANAVHASHAANELDPRVSTGNSLTSTDSRTSRSGNVNPSSAVASNLAGSHTIGASGTRASIAGRDGQFDVQEVEQT
jgi:hypothetical protein